jgi:hypothetical protein
MALIAASLWVVAPIVWRLLLPLWMQNADQNGLGLTTSDAISAANALASLLLFAYTRATTRDPRWILDLGLGYMVLMALGSRWPPIQRQPISRCRCLHRSRGSARSS